jgi:tRNA-binding EMAP/Myf-like protein
MAEMILPGTYIEVRAEGLIVPGRVTVGNVGVVGTASKGPVGKPVILGSYTDARQRFGDYDAWEDGASDELTMVRALQLAFDHGATTVYAVRVASDAAAKSTYILQSAGGDCVELTAKSKGTWGNDLSVNVWKAEEDAYIEDETPAINAGPPVTVDALSHHPVVKSARNRITLYTARDGLTRRLGILYDDDTDDPAAGQVKVNREDGEMAFGDAIEVGDEVTVSYVVHSDKAVKVTLRYGEEKEHYTVVSGADLVSDINADLVSDKKEGSAWVKAKAVEANASELPEKNPSAEDFAAFSGGVNGASGADYKEGLNMLLNEDAHIILAAGQDDSFADELDAHCQVASSDAHQRERIAVVGSRRGASVDDLRGHNIASDRVIFVAPGIKITDAPSNKEVKLGGAYTAAAIAGLLAGFPPHFSPTNKTVRVGELEKIFTKAELTQLLQSRILVLERRQGLRIVKGITTSTNTAWHQITTRRIVDYAKFGVRSASNPYIGLLNNERVRGAMRATINSFLAEMVEDEMLISYELDVTATREEQRKGIARVTMVLRPVFSIDFIKVTMFLE